MASPVRTWGTLLPLTPFGQVCLNSGKKNGPDAHETHPCGMKCGSKGHGRHG